MCDTGVRCAMWGYVRAAYVCAMRFIYQYFDRHTKLTIAVAPLKRLAHHASKDRADIVGASLG